LRNLTINPTLRQYFRSHIALPSEHGSWVFLLSPLLIGVFAGNSFTISSIFLVVALLAAFLIRQPVIIAVKAYSGRRSRTELPVVRFWIAIYSLICFTALIGLFFNGYAYLLYLAIPGVPVFIWHLWLVSHRKERRQAGVEILGSGVLALSAPAAMWVGSGIADPTGWLLFLLTWFQSAASIVYAYLRLEQRELKSLPPVSTRWRMATRALLYTSFNLAIVTGTSLFGITPGLLFIPFALQWLETIHGTLHPAIGMKPTRIGLRQLAVSSLFTLLFILTWRVI
jgi:hypothetical protein